MKYLNKISVVGVLAIICLLLTNAYSKETSSKYFRQRINPEFDNYLTNYKEGKIQQTWGEHSLGLIPDLLDWSHLNSGAIKNKIKNKMKYDFPTSYDLRELNRVTSPKNQLTCGSCWAFAAMGSLESMLMPDEQWNFSENHINNKHGFNVAFCEGGFREMTTAYFSRMHGPVLESDDPYDPYTPTSPDIDPKTQKHVTDVLYLPGKRGSGDSYAYDNDVIKWALMEYGAIQTSIFMGVDENSFYRENFASFYNPGNDIDSYGGSHAVVIVGWDDNYPATKFKLDPPGNGAYIVKNSWGPTWGENGYFYVSYYDMRVGRELTVYKVSDNTDMTMYMYDPLGVTESYGNSYSGWGANIFTSTRSLPIASVGFFTLDDYTDYEIYIYDNVTSTPTNGNLINTTTGTSEFAGYHTIQLSETGLVIEEGHRFSVVVKFTSQDDYSPVPMENASDRWATYNARANSGESFISSNGSSWTDATYYDSTANVCIRALFINCLNDSDCKDDGLSCTDAVCDGHLGCTHVVKDDYCLIDNMCQAKFNENPDSTCQECNPDLSQKTWSPKTENSSCNDNNSCTKDDKCLSGTCTGTQYLCDDNLDCTRNTCDGKGGCSYEVKDNFCLIDNNCYSNGNTKPLDICHICSTDKSNSEWVNSPSSTLCNDKNSCTFNDHCEEGSCIGGDDMVCDDNNDCTSESCDPEEGCSFTKVEDGTVCNENEGVFNCYDGTCIQTGCTGQCSSDVTSCIDESTVCQCSNGTWSELDCDEFCEKQGRTSNGCDQIGVGDSYGCSCGAKTDTSDTDGDIEPTEDGDSDSTETGSGENGSSGCQSTSGASALIMLLGFAILFARRKALSLN